MPTDQSPHEAPVDQSNAVLHGGGPVGALGVRALSQPAPEQLTQPLEIAAIAVQRMSLCQGDPPEVAVHLPEELDVHAGEVAKVEKQAEASVDASARDRIHIPLRDPAGHRNGTAEDFELTVQQLLRSRAHLLGPGRIRARVRTPGASPPSIVGVSRKRGCVERASALCDAANDRPCAIRDLLPVHPTEPTKKPRQP